MGLEMLFKKKFRDVWTHPKNNRHLVALIRVHFDGTG